MKRLLLFFCLPALGVAQPTPSHETLALSLRTISKALAGCREVYVKTTLGSSAPILKLVLKQGDYEKEIKNLAMAESLTNGLITHPDRITGKGLVAVLSTMDDVSVGAGSTRFELLSAAITGNTAVSNSSDLVLMSENVNTCQKSIFNAGDDYVGLVLDYVGAQDRSLEQSHSKSR